MLILHVLCLSTQKYHTVHDLHFMDKYLRILMGSHSHASLLHHITCALVPPHFYLTMTTLAKKTHLIGLQALAVIREHFASLGPQEMELDSVAV